LYVNSTFRSRDVRLSLTRRRCGAYSTKVKTEEKEMDVGLLGLLAVFMCPMIFGGITFYYSHKYTDKVTRDWWKKYE
jgi:hypothetical protein